MLSLMGQTKPSQATSLHDTHVYSAVQTQSGKHPQGEHILELHGCSLPPENFHPTQLDLLVSSGTTPAHTHLRKNPQHFIYWSGDWTNSKLNSGVSQYAVCLDLEYFQDISHWQTDKILKIQKGTICLSYCWNNSFCFSSGSRTQVKKHYVDHDRSLCKHTLLHR